MRASVRTGCVDRSAWPSTPGNSQLATYICHPCSGLAPSSRSSSDISPRQVSVQYNVPTARTLTRVFPEMFRFTINLQSPSLFRVPQKVQADYSIPYYELYRAYHPLMLSSSDDDVHLRTQPPATTRRTAPHGNRTRQESKSVDKGNKREYI